MMKTVMYALLLFASAYSNAQVDLHSRPVQAKTALDVRTGDTNISSSRTASLSKKEVTTITDSKGASFVWNGTKWDYFFADLNHSDSQNQVKNYYANSQVAYTFSKNANQFMGYTSHSNGETLNTSEWTVISAITKEIAVDRSENEILMTLNGMYQANNVALKNEGITSTIGFFIDDKLIDVKPMFLDFTEKCANREFMIYGVAKNLSVGHHKVKFAIRNIDAPAMPGLSVTYGSTNPASNCSSFRTAPSGISSTIFINQP